MTNYVIGLSPLTNKIFAGTTRTLKDGSVLWNQKTDVTGDACAAVMELAIRKGGQLTLTMGDGSKCLIVCAKLDAAADRLLEGE